MPEGNLPQHIFMQGDTTDPGLAALLVDGTPYEFYSAIIDDTLINRIVDQHLCHLEVAHS